MFLQVAQMSIMSCLEDVGLLDIEQMYCYVYQDVIQTCNNFVIDGITILCELNIIVPSYSYILNVFLLIIAVEELMTFLILEIPMP